jgi:hypothetical protein
LTLTSEILGEEGLPFSAFPVPECRTKDEEGDLMPLTCADASAFVSFVFTYELEVVLSEGRIRSPLDPFVPPSPILILSEIKCNRLLKITN